MAINKITNAQRDEVKISGLPDKPGLTKEAIQQRFDGLGNLAIDKINEVIDNVNETEKEIKDLDSRVDQIANNQIPEEYVQSAVETYVNNNQSELATKKNLEELDNQLSSEIEENNNAIGGVCAMRFVNGGVNNGIVYTDRMLYKIVMKEYVSFNYDVTIEAKQGFKILVVFKDINGNIEDEYGNKVYQVGLLDKTTQHKGRAFRLCVERENPIDNEIADITEFKSAIIIRDAIYYKDFSYDSTINNDSDLSKFENGVVSCHYMPISHKGGFPTSAGILITHRNGDDAYSYQEWKSQDSKSVYIRNWTSTTEHGEWFELATTDLMFNKAKANAHTQRIPTISFISDDGTLSDYTLLKPLSEKYNVPFCTAVMTSAIGETVGGYPHMSATQLQELNRVYGWEFLSHTHNHVKLATLTETQVRNECKESIKTLKNLNLSCRGIVYPEGNNNEMVRRVVADYFDYGVRVEDIGLTVNDGVIGNFYIHRCNLGSFFDPQRVGYPATNTLEYYKKLVDECIEKNGWLIFELHTWREEFDTTQQQYLDDVIAYIKEKGVLIKTPSNAFDVFGNQIQSGDFLGKRNTKGLAIDKGGNIVTFNPSSQKNTSVTNSTPSTEFEFNKTTIFAISKYDGSGIEKGFPTSYGLLETKRYVDYNFTCQVWYSCENNKVYYRRALSDTTWDEWVNITN